PQFLRKWPESFMLLQGLSVIFYKIFQSGFCLYFFRLLFIHLSLRFLNGTFPLQLFLQALNLLLQWLPERLFFIERGKEIFLPVIFQQFWLKQSNSLLLLNNFDIGKLELFPGFFSQLPINSRTCDLFKQ